jgi:hypothetical protein
MEKNRAFLITFIIKTDSLLEPFNWKSTILQAFAFYQTLLTGPIEIASSSELHIFQLCEGSCGEPLKEKKKKDSQDRKLGAQHASIWLEPQHTVKEPFYYVKGGGK